MKDLIGPGFNLESEDASLKYFEQRSDLANCMFCKVTLTKDREWNRGGVGLASLPARSHSGSCCLDSDKKLVEEGRLGVSVT